MIEEVAGWLPDHSFILGCDGSYSSLAGRDLPRTHIVSRIQSNAALYKPAPPRRPDQRGRPRKKGDRLGTPAELAGQAIDGWTMADIDVRGEQVERALWARPLFWYAVRPLQQIMLVDRRRSCPTRARRPPVLHRPDHPARAGTPDAGRSRTPSATPSSCWAASSPKPGRRRARSERPRSPFGPTRRSGSGTWPATATDRLGGCDPGTRPS